MPWSAVALWEGPSYACTATVKTVGPSEMRTSKPLSRASRANYSVQFHPVRRWTDSPLLSLGAMGCNTVEQWREKIVKMWHGRDSNLYTRKSALSEKAHCDQSRSPAR